MTILFKAISSTTASLRFKGDLNVDLADIRNSLVPYPRIRFPVVTYAPLQAKDQINKLNTLQELTVACFDPKNFMASIDPRHGKYISCFLLARGDIAPSEVNMAIRDIKHWSWDRSTPVPRPWFVGWCPTGFKVGLNNEPPTVVPGSDQREVTRALCMLSNTTAMVGKFARISYKFDLLYAKRSFVHWFVDEGTGSKSP